MKKLMILMLIAMAAIATSCKEDEPIVPDPTDTTTVQLPEKITVTINFTIPTAETEGLTINGGGMSLTNKNVTDEWGMPLILDKDFVGSNTTVSLIISDKEEVKNFFNESVDVLLYVAARDGIGGLHDFYGRLPNQKITEEVTTYNITL